MKEVIADLLSAIGLGAALIGAPIVGVFAVWCGFHPCGDIALTALLGGIALFNIAFITDRM